jgi:hypothetical protein
MENADSFSSSPQMIALGIVITLALVYVAYIWYKGRNTVPVPAYISGFQNPPGEEDESKKKLSTSQEVRIVNEYFTNAPGTPAKTANPAGTASFNPQGHALGVTEVGQVTIDPLAKVPTAEGFYGGAARGTGSPDCLRSSAEGAELIGMFTGRGESTVEEGDADLRELTQIVGKLSCFKKDLVSPSHIVEATRYQQFVTMHDIEPIAETTGRCFAKTISPRDLEIAFDKWNTRGELLIRRLCTAYRLKPEEVEKAGKLFAYVLRDVKDIARGACLAGEPMIAGKPGPREPHPFEEPKFAELGEYTGYY